jgi:uncharacterized membrane protein YfcA
MSEWEAIGLLAAAFVAGAINAVAGGGSLISFPALLAAGYPSKTANVTNTVALWPGYVGGSLGYREELRGQRWRLIQLSLPNVAGALVGAVILLSTPQSAFDAVVPFLIVFACALMALQDRIGAYTAHHRAAFEASGRVPLLAHAVMFALGVYGAYFGAALGIMTLAVFTILLADDIQRLNALKGMSSLIVNGVAVLWFAAFGPVAWAPAAVMAAGALAGGYLGVGVARRLGVRWLRIAVIGYGLTVAAVLFWRLAAA